MEVATVVFFAVAIFPRKCRLPMAFSACLPRWARLMNARVFDRRRLVESGQRDRRRVKDERTGICARKNASSA